MEADARTDAELITGLRLDPGLLGLLYERHAAAVYRYLARRTAVAAAEDLLAEVFTAALTSRHRVRAHRSGSALPWLYGIAGNVLRSHLRHPDRHPPVGVELSVDWDAVDDRVDAQSQRRQLRRALEGLTVVERDLLLLVAWEHLTVTEAATALGITATAARSRLHRARRHAEHVLASGSFPPPPAVSVTPHRARALHCPEPEDRP